MSLFTKSVLGNFIRGGQTTIHHLRMIVQVIKQFTFVTILLAFGGYLSIFYYTTNKQEHKFAIEYSVAWYHSELFKDKGKLMYFHRLNGEQIRTNAHSIINNKQTSDRLQEIKRKALLSVYYAVALWFFIIFLVVRFIYTTGQSHKEDEHVRGGLLVNIKDLNRRLSKWLRKQKKDQGTLNLLGVNLPKDFEPAHILVAGDPGTGKSNLLRQCFKSIRQAKQRAIIYDRSGDFVKNFYRDGKDIILNPLDVRGVDWNLFAECSAEHEFYELACSFIPELKSNDPFWTLAARIIFSSMAFQESKKTNPSTSRLIKTIINSGLDELMEHCEGTDAQAIITKGGEKMAINVRGVLVTYIVSLKYLREVEDGFSIKEWVGNEGADSWIFITSKRNIHNTIKPLITSWIDIATSSILSLEPDLNRRIWISIDELPTLHKIPSIQETPAESRKYGGCFIIGFQNFPQLLDIYGKNGANSLCGSCSTSVIFRCNDTEFAQWGSKQLGRAEMVETTEGISYGVNDIRDGVNLGKNKRERAVVLSTELQNLPDLQGYLKIGRGFPVASFADKFMVMDKITDGFIALPDNEGTDEFGASIPSEPQEEAPYINSWNCEVQPRESISPSQPKDAWQINTSVKLDVKEQLPSQTKREPHTEVPTDLGNAGFLRGELKNKKRVGNADSTGERAMNTFTNNLPPQGDGPDMELD